MRFRRLLCSVLLLASALALLAAPSPGAFAGAGPVGGYTAGSTGRQAPTVLHGSVIVENDKSVTAAGTDLAAYTADRYIVTYTDAVTDVAATTARLATAIGFSPSLVYTERVRGFAAKLTDKQLAKVKARKEIAAVEADEVIPAPRAYGMPTGVARVGALASAAAKINGVDQRVDADVAVIDTGVDYNHPDLNVTATFDCTQANGTGADDMGHGTHVAGTIGALDDGVGVTGVAPGARIWDIKIFDAQGGTKSWAICGLETAADYGDAIDVANLSWGWTESNPGEACGDTAIHQAVCDAFNAGITLVNAAGNDARDAASSVPSTFSQVITVSALADSDGKPGGKGPDTDYGCDDCFATFSNFGADVDLAAPGVDILSTCPLYLSCNAGSGLAVESGTSMSTPHVAGAAALYIARNGRVGPANVRAALIAKGEPGSIPGDRDGIHEPVLYAGDLAPSCALDPTSATPKTSVLLTCTGFRATEPVTVYQETSSGTKLGAFTASSRGNGSLLIVAPATTRGSHAVAAKGKYSRRTTTATLRIQAGMTLSPPAGAAGRSVNVVLAGFGGNEAVTVRFDPGRTSEKTLKTGNSTNASGSTTFNVTIPATATVAKHKIEASGSNGSKVTVTFTVTAAAAASIAETSPTSSPSPTATATATPTPTAQPTEQPTMEPTVEATATSTPTEAPMVEPSPTAEQPQPTEAASTPTP